MFFSTGLSFLFTIIIILCVSWLKLVVRARQNDIKALIFVLRLFSVRIRNRHWGLNDLLMLVHVLRGRKGAEENIWCIRVNSYGLEAIIWLIESCRHFLSWVFSSLPFDELAQLLLDCHVLLLQSWALISDWSSLGYLLVVHFYDRTEPVRSLVLVLRCLRLIFCNSAKGSPTRLATLPRVLGLCETKSAELSRLASSWTVWGRAARLASGPASQLKLGQEWLFYFRWW